MSKLPDTYPNFEHKASELNKFIAASNMITLLLKNGEIVHYFPDDKPAFVQWLSDHKIENIK